MRAKFLECVICAKRFSAKDVKDGKFFPSTQVCKECYSQGVVENNDVWCFGDYRPKEFRECRIDCPDRRVCRIFTHSRRGEVYGVKGTGEGSRRGRD